MTQNLVINTSIASGIGSVPSIKEQLAATYIAGQTISQLITLNAGQQWASTVGFSAISITPSGGPVQLTAARGSNPAYLNQIVNQQTTIDDTVDLFQIVNESTTAVVSVRVVYVVAIGTAPPTPGIVTSVNGRTGAVTLMSSDITGAGGVLASSLALVATSGNYNDLLNKYTLPIATTSVLGGVKAGTGVSIASDGTINVTVSGGSTVAFTSVPLIATANGQSVFTVPGGYTVGLINLYGFGDYLIGGLQYTATDGETITLSSAVAANIVVGVELTLQIFSSFDVANAVAATTLAGAGGAALVGTSEGPTVQQSLDTLNTRLTNALVNTSVACTSLGQTVYPIPGGYPINLIDVFAMGVHQDPSDFTATDGLNVVISAATAARMPIGAKLLVSSIGSFNVANAAQLTTLGATGGAALIGTSGGPTVQQTLDILGQANVSDYSALAAYSGAATKVFVTQQQHAGDFEVDPTDTTTSTNNGTVIVDALNRRWKRVNYTVIQCSWFTVGPSYVINGAALAAAHAASKGAGTIPQFPIYANGVTIDVPVIFDGGDDLVHNADLGCTLDVTLLNVSITPGVGTAITIRNARKPRWRISVVGSGTEHNQVDTSTPPNVVLAGTDIAVSHYNVEGAEFDLEGYNFRGILSYYNGANGQWLENKSARILGRTCFQTVNWVGNTSTGDAAVGVINSIWDVIPFFRSQISWLGDLNIHHYESSVVNTFQIAGGSLEISHVGSCHLGKINLGNNAQYMLRVFGASSQVDIDELYCLGNGTVVNGKSNGDSTTNGLEIADTSFVSIGTFVGSQCNTAFVVDGGARLAIGTFNGNNNTWDMGLQQGLSTSLSMDVDIGTYHSNGVYNGSVQYRGNVSGRLAINKGFIRSGNVTASTTIPAIDLTGVSASFFFSVGGLTIDNSWSIGVEHYYLGCVLASGGNQVACATPLIDSFGHKGGADLVTLVMPLPVSPPVIGTTYTNILPYAMLLYIPINFGSASVAGDYAAVKLTDPFGNIYDLASRISVNMDALPNIATLGPILVGPGWSFVISASNTGTNRVALQSTQNPYWIRT
jgi:hypothetical protein